jgi:Aspartyl protease
VSLRAWIALSCLIGNLGLLSDRAFAETCELKRLASVDLIIRNDQLMIPVTVNGHPATMTPDTSTGRGWISSIYLERLGLSPGHYPPIAVMLDGVVMSQITTPDSFAVGPMRYRDVPFYILPDRREPSKDDVPNVGTVGMDVLGATDFELDFAKRRLNFYSSDHCPGKVVYWTDHYSSARIHRGPAGNYFFPMEIEGKKVLAELSTGTPVTEFGTDATRKLFGFDEKSSGIETETDPDGKTVSHYRAMALTGAGITIKNAQIRLQSPKLPPYVCEVVLHGGPDGAAYRRRCDGGDAPLSLGLNVARRLHLYFATRERVLYFSDVDATK